MSDISKKEQEQLINSIISSQLISTKIVLKNLLIYLYKKRKAGLPVCEIDIASDVFNRGADFNSTDDTIVRVNLHKLRKALEHYFLDEGKQSKIILEIPKGSYVPTFKYKAVQNRTYRKNNRVLLLAFIILASVNIVYLFYQKQKQAYSYIWDTYFTSKKPICITLGDPFFFRVDNQETKSSYIVRDVNINSEANLDTAPLPEFIKNSSELKPLEYSYFSQNNVWPLFDVVSSFVKHDVEPTIMPLSQLNAMDIKMYNHIVMGNINSLGAFTPYLEQSSIRIKTNPRRIIVCKNKQDSLVFNMGEQVKGYYLDYAFLVKVPGIENTVVSILGDFHASGNKGLSHFIANAKDFNRFVKSIESEYGHFPEYFEMMVEVKSYDYIDFETKVVFFNPITIEKNGDVLLPGMIL